MTLVGKILVVFITIFSLVFMGFAVTVFTTQVSWKQRFETEKTELGKLTLKKTSLEEQAKVLRETLSQQIETHKKEREQFLVETKDQQKNLNALLDRYEQAQVDVVKYQAQTKLALDEAQARREEVQKPDEGLRDQLKRTREQKEDAVRKQFEATQARIELQGQYDTAATRNKDLEQEVGELRAVLDSHGLPKEAKEKTKAMLENPPPVEGVITEVDPEGRRVRISIGSDDGLRKGHRLEVYRLKPDGKYVGKIELTEVDPDHAVGRILPQFRRATMQEGDLVANRITASR